MPRVDIAVQDIPFQGYIAPTLVEGDDTNDMQFLNDGKIVLLAFNKDGATKDITLVSVANEYGRTGDITLTVDAAVGGADGLGVFGPMNPSIWNQSDGYVHVDMPTQTSGIHLCALRINTGEV